MILAIRIGRSGARKRVVVKRRRRAGWQLIRLADRIANIKLSKGPVKVIRSDDTELRAQLLDIARAVRQFGKKLVSSQPSGRLRAGG